MYDQKPRKFTAHRIDVDTVNEYVTKLKKFK